MVTLSCVIDDCDRWLWSISRLQTLICYIITNLMSALKTNIIVYTQTLNITHVYVICCLPLTPAKSPAFCGVVLPNFTRLPLPLYPTRFWIKSVFFHIFTFSPVLSFFPLYSLTNYRVPYLLHSSLNLSIYCYY